MINEIHNKQVFTTNPVEDIEVQIKHNGEVVYQNKVIACTLNAVETCDMNLLEPEGITQTFFVGHPFLIYFSSDQLAQKLKKANIIKKAIEWIKWRMEGINDPQLKQVLKVFEEFLKT